MTATLAALAGPLATTLAAELAPMHDRQRLVALVLAVGVVATVFELVRRRKLREEYSWVWVAVAVLVAVLALHQELLLTVSQWIGASSSVSTLFFGALLFLFALVLQFSVRLSRLTHRHKTLGQRLALLEAQLLERNRERDAGRTAAEVEPPARTGGQDEVA